MEASEWGLSRTEQNEKELEENLSIKIYIDNSGIGSNLHVSLYFKGKKISDDSIGIYEIKQALDKPF